MEFGLPMLNCVLQQTLRSLCTLQDSSSSKWVYAVFWRVLPRNYPPPKWDDLGDCLIDRAKGNKRNWILVWEDGFCDFCECERAGNGYSKGRFGADIFFKMSHEVYNFGEGLVGKVAADNSHKWIFRDSPTENDPSSISSWNVSIDPQPRAWEAQFNSGIETIAIIPLREGAVQLGSFDKVVEDPNLVLSIQGKFSYLLSIPGVHAIQRPYLTTLNPYNFDGDNSHMIMASNGSICRRIDDRRQTIGLKRRNYEQSDDSLTKSIYLGRNSPQNGFNGGLPLWSIPPLFPSTTCNHGAFLSKMPLVPPSYYAHEAIDHENGLLNINLKSGTSQNLKTDECGVTFDEIALGDVKVEMSQELVQEGEPIPFESRRGLESVANHN